MLLLGLLLTYSLTNLATIAKSLNKRLVMGEL